MVVVSQSPSPLHQMVACTMANFFQSQSLSRACLVFGWCNKNEPRIDVGIGGSNPAVSDTQLEYSSRIFLLLCNKKASSWSLFYYYNFNAYTFVWLRLNLRSGGGFSYLYALKRVGMTQGWTIKYGMVW